MRTGNQKKIENLKKNGAKIIATHSTQDYGFMSRRHIGHLKEWNNHTVIQLGWGDYSNFDYVLIDE